MIRRLRWHWPSGKKLTFLYVPDDAAVRQFRVPQLAFHSVVAVFVIGLGLLGYFGSQWIRAAAEGREMLRLRGENIELREQLAELEMHFEDLRGELASTQEIQQRLRLLTDLETLHPDVLLAGVGGPEIVSDDGGALPADLRGDLERTGSRLSQMLRQARIQRESFDEILALVEQNKQGWDHTPSVRPVRTGFISSRFGRRMDPFTGQTAVHRGVDFAARRGDHVYSTADGIVTKAGRWGAYGLLVEIDHGNGLRTRYAHCSKLNVKKGQRVKRDDLIAFVGSTGKSTSSHVHYEVLRNGLHQDPMKFLLPQSVIVD